MHAINFYPNFVPIQELSDWFEHWATKGVKPVFTCEYGAPFTWDWTMYRGWYKGATRIRQRESAVGILPGRVERAVLRRPGLSRSANRRKANLRWEAKQFRAGNLWHRWDYPNEVGSPRFDERYPVFAMYLTDNWRAFRTWGVSAISPWEYGHFWKLRDGVNKRREEFKVDWENLQRPGFSPDYSEQRYERMDLAFERSDWIATPAAQALLRNNRPLLAYLGGKPADSRARTTISFPAKRSRNRSSSSTIRAKPITCDSQWSLGLPRAVTGQDRVTVAAGQQERIPLRFELPATLTPGRYELSASFKFSNGETQTDSFSIHVLPRPRLRCEAQRSPCSIPKAKTALLGTMGVRGQSVERYADLSPYDILIVGKAALTAGGPAPDITRVRDGLKVIVFEQTSEVLEKRFGFRVEEYGLRQVFPRVPDHPVLAGLDAGESCATGAARQRSFPRG